MAKLYPPYINGTIPAFYCAEGTTKTSIVSDCTVEYAIKPVGIESSSKIIQLISSFSREEIKSSYSRGSISNL